VLDQQETLPPQFTYRVICGPTGSGKTRLLAALAAQGKQVLDLEGLAQHRGSVLGRLPQQAQPSQKCFDSQLLLALQALAPALPVYVEAESSKIGLLSLPPALFAAMHESECLLMETPLAVRVAGLLEDYRHYVENPPLFIEHLQPLSRFHGAKQLQQWTDSIRSGDCATVVSELLTLHYDPSYQRAALRNYPKLPSAQHVYTPDISRDALEELSVTL